MVVLFPTRKTKFPACVPFDLSIMTVDPHDRAALMLGIVLWGLYAISITAHTQAPRGQCSGLEMKIELGKPKLNLKTSL